MILRNRILGGLGAGARAALQPYLRETELGRDEVLAEPDDEAVHVWFPETAVLSAVRVMGDGRTVEVAAIGHEGGVDLLACLTAGRSRTRLVVRIAGRAVVVRSAALRALAESHPELRMALLDGVRFASDQVELNLACNAQHDVAARLARCLLETRDKAGSDGLLLTQGELAVLLGVQRTTVNAAALHLKAAGAILYSRGTVRVLDAARLTAAACECYDPLDLADEPGGVVRRTA